MANEERSSSLPLPMLNKREKLLSTREGRLVKDKDGTVGIACMKMKDELWQISRLAYEGRMRVSSFRLGKRTLFGDIMPALYTIREERLHHY